MNQTIFVRNKHIISRMMYFFHNKFYVLCDILLWEEFFKILWLCFPRTFSSGQNSDAVSIIFLIMGVRGVMFYSEGAEVSATDPLSLLSYIISSKLWAFGITHDVKADFRRGLLSISPETPLPSELLLEWNIDNTDNPFQSIMIANYHLQLVHKQSPPPSTCLLHFNFNILHNDPFWWLVIAFDRFHR